jgi:hypothetical protein
MTIKVKIDLEQMRKELERKAELKEKREKLGVNVGDRLEKKPKPEKIQ